MSILMYGSKTMIWMEKDKSRIRAVQMNNLRGLLGIWRVDRVLNIQIRKLCGVMKEVDESVDKNVLKWFRHIERMGNDRIAKKMCVRLCG